MNSWACFLLALNRLSAPFPGNSPISVQLRTNFVDSWSIFSGNKSMEIKAWLRQKIRIWSLLYIVILRAPSMCGHKGTKIFLMNFSLFVDCCLPRFFCLYNSLRRNSQIRQVRGTLGEERQTRQITVLISFPELYLLAVRLYFVWKWRTNWIAATAWDILYGLAIGDINQIVLD